MQNNFLKLKYYINTVTKTLMETLIEVIRKMKSLQDAMEKKILKIQKNFNFWPSSMHLLIQQWTIWHRKRLEKLHRKYEILSFNRKNNKEYYPVEQFKKDKEDLKRAMPIFNSWGL